MTITIDTAIRLVPVEKVNLFNTALPAANTNLVATGITSTYGTSSDLTIYVCISVAGVLSITRTVSGTTLSEKLNSGNTLVAGAAYLFTVPIKPGNTINLQYSVTTGTINSLIIDETSGGT